MGNLEVGSCNRYHGVSPFPVDIKADRGKTIALPGAVTFDLRFGAKIHEKPTSAEYDPDTAFENYQAALQ